MSLFAGLEHWTGLLDWTTGRVILGKSINDVITNRRHRVLYGSLRSDLCANGFEPIYCTDHFNLYAKDRKTFQINQRGYHSTCCLPTGFQGRWCCMIEIFPVSPVYFPVVFVLASDGRGKHTFGINSHYRF